MGQINFKESIEKMKACGFNPFPDRVNISIQDAKDVLLRGLNYFEPGAKWLPEYDEVVDWLSDNKGRGILCYGNCGRGKSLICCKIMPLILNHYCNKIVSLYTAPQMNALLDSVIKNHIICIDDIGVESLSVKYGEKRMSFCEIVDEAEKNGKLLIITTNLTTDQIAAKYGERTMDRLIAITRRVKFVGESLRR